MSQEQQRKPEPVKYGDVFNVSGELSSQPVAPRDAAVMQSAETAVFGQTQKGGPAAAMQSAADFNQALGVVGHDQMSDVARDQGVRLAQGFVAGTPVIAEAVGGQVVGGYAVRAGQGGGGQGGEGREDSRAVGGGDKITIGEALEATEKVIGDKPVDQSDAAAIQAAEVRATGRGQVLPGGIGAEAQAAAILNRHTMRDEHKTKLSEILADASDRLPEDKPVTREDAEGVLAAEFRNDPLNAPHPGGVAAALAAASRLNEGGHRLT